MTLYTQAELEDVFKATFHELCANSWVDLGVRLIDREDENGFTVRVRRLRENNRAISVTVPGDMDEKDAFMEAAVDLAQMVNSYDRRVIAPDSQVVLTYGEEADDRGQKTWYEQFFVRRSSGTLRGMLAQEIAIWKGYKGGAYERGDYELPGVSIEEHAHHMEMLREAERLDDTERAAKLAEVHRIKEEAARMEYEEQRQRAVLEAQQELARKEQKRLELERKMKAQQEEEARRQKAKEDFYANAGDYGDF